VTRIVAAADHRSTDRAPSAALLVAWGATLLLSRLPEIILREVVGWDVPWINIVWIVAAAGLIVAAMVVPLMRPLRDYFIVMLSVLVLTTVVDPFVRAALFGNIAPAATDPQLRRLFAERALLVLEALAIIAVLAALGYRGREAYIALGKLSAPSGLRIGRRVLSWGVVGPVVAILLVAATAAFASSLAPPTPDVWSRALPLLPIAWLAAALNAFAEEVLYRAGPLGPLARAVGPRAAIWILAAWFGLGHVYGGIPSGVMGLVMAGLLGLFWGKAMINTRGLGVPWALHFSADAAIYTFLAIGAVAGTT
jgi:membrane protease YdiL (CAAX protease family)